MMNKIPQAELRRADFNEMWFEAVFKAVDRLHDEVSAGHLRAVSPLHPALMVGWLEDIIYTAQEAIFEIRAQMPVTDGDPIALKSPLESEG